MTSPFNIADILYTVRLYEKQCPALQWGHYCLTAARTIIRNNLLGDQATGHGNRAAKRVAALELARASQEHEAWFDSLKPTAAELDQMAEVMSEGRVRTTFMSRRHAASYSHDEK